MWVSDCVALRREVKATAEKLAALYWSALPYSQDPTRGEAMANAMLAYEHLEDASMRLGKAIQVLNSGTSVYDKTQTPGAIR
jgi:hypothetical protein